MQAARREVKLNGNKTITNLMACSSFKIKVFSSKYLKSHTLEPKKGNILIVMDVFSRHT